LRAKHGVRFDQRHLVDAKHPIIVEVALLDAPSGKRNLVVQDGGDTEHNAALNLGHQRVGIHHAATCGCNDDARHPDIGLIGHGHIGDAR
jgi:hypothetical protein